MFKVIALEQRQCLTMAQSDSNGYTPIYLSAIIGNTECVKLLLYFNSGSGVIKRTFKCRTPLDVAKKRGQTDIVHILQQHIENVRSD